MENRTVKKVVRIKIKRNTRIR
uniref:Uncharacterized protein n=1 Tax=Lotus japonicus TaxID=34305 RepID=I3S433_LOTJA|nr:unknown [Lotus japonicus]